MPPLLDTLRQPPQPAGTRLAGSLQEDFGDQADQGVLPPDPISNMAPGREPELRAAPKPSLGGYAIEKMQGLFMGVGMDPYRAGQLAKQIVGNEQYLGLMDVAPSTWWWKAFDRAGTAMRDENYGEAAIHAALGSLGPFGRTIFKAVEAGARRAMPGAFKSPFGPTSRAEAISANRPQGMDFDIIGTAEDVVIHGARAPAIAAASAPKPPISFGPLRKPPAPEPPAVIPDELPFEIPVYYMPAPEPVAGPVYQSGVERLLEALPQEKMTTGQAAAALRGASADEMQHTGLQELLMAGGKTTKTDLLAQARANPLEIVDVEKRGSVGDVQALQNPDGTYRVTNPAGDDLGGPFATLDEAFHHPVPDETKFATYQLPGGENYRETLLTLPDAAAATAERLDYRIKTIRTTLENAGDLSRYSHMRPDALAKIRAKREELIQEHMDLVSEKEALGAGDVFRGGHYDEPNVLAHARYNTRDIDGDKTLFLEEVQSDWHQRGRKVGYERKTAAEAREAEELVSKGIGALSEAQSARLDDLLAKGGDVPDAPFKKNWHELTLKRMIREAAETGHDRIAWTPGEVQADRYDLSKHIDKLTWNETTKQLIGQDKNHKTVLIQNDVTADQLPDYIGKDGAEKLLAVESTPGTGSFKNEKWKALSGADLKVGGEGMKAFYDKMMVAAANKIGKKFGAKVEVKHLKTPTEDIAPSGRRFTLEEAREDLARMDAGGGKEVWSMKITPALRREILEKGVSPYRPDVLRRDQAGRPLERAPLPPPAVGDALLEAMGPLTQSLAAPAPAVLHLSPSESASSLGDVIYNPAFTRVTEKRTIEDIARDLNAKTLEATGGELRDDEGISRILANEIWQALQRERHGGTWYGEKITGAHHIAALEFPELLTDPVAKAKFNFITAIMSNGTRVVENAGLGWRGYSEYKRTGKMPAKGSGKEHAAQVFAFRLWDRLAQEMGEADLIHFLTTKHLVRDINAMGIGKPVSGELVDEMVYGGAIFGPKVGGAFFPNLEGFFDALTMDRWLMRTVGRIRGDLISEPPAATTTKRIRRFRKSLTKSNVTRYGYTLEEVRDDQAKLLELAGKAFKQYSDSGFKKRTEFNKAAQRIAESKALLEQPQNPSDRRAIRGIFTRTLELLDGVGVQTTLADSQATVWYPEQQLYEALGAPSAGRSQIDFEEAFKMYARQRGFTEDEVNAAISRSRGR